MAAAFLKVEELELSEPEAKQLGEAVARVNALYGNYMIPEKTAAWINLTMAAGSIYGPRMMAHKLRVKKEKASGKGPVTIDSQKVM